MSPTPATPRPPRSPWWREGIRFDCQGTGRCCLSRGTHGYVYLTQKDRRRMARVLGLATREFTRDYCAKADGWFYLKNPAAAKDPRSPKVAEACRFLDGKRCAVYEGRPAQCRTWPFWPENMGAKAWDTEVTKFCPGIGQGKLYSADEIRRLLSEDPLNEGA